MSTTQEVRREAGDIPPSQTIVERIASHEGVEHTELVPLYEAIDPEALDRLVETNRHEESALEIQFIYHGYEVTVNGDGVVHLAHEADIVG